VWSRRCPFSRKNRVLYILGVNALDWTNFLFQ
jgi:hypothetical protein